MEASAPNHVDEDDLYVVKVGAALGWSRAAFIYRLGSAEGFDPKQDKMGRFVTCVFHFLMESPFPIESTSIGIVS